MNRAEKSIYSTTMSDFLFLFDGCVLKVYNECISVIK